MRKPFSAAIVPSRLALEKGKGKSDRLVNGRRNSREKKIYTQRVFSFQLRNGEQQDCFLLLLLSFLLQSMGMSEKEEGGRLRNYTKEKQILFDIPSHIYA